jgi:hypothetical protein
MDLLVHKFKQLVSESINRIYLFFDFLRIIEHCPPSLCTVVAYC